MLKNKNIVLLLLLAILVLSSFDVLALPKNYGKDDKNDKIKRTVSQIYDLQRNTVSNIQFYTTNYGIFGNNVETNKGGGFWPRGSLNQYIFGGGIWFASTKKRSDGDGYRKMCEVTYNPNNGRSWMVPGSVQDNNRTKGKIDETSVTKYRTYFSTDFRSASGEPINENDGESWPIWDSSTDKDTLKYNRYFGYYIWDTETRNKTSFPKGPAYISGEDIFCAFKDSDLEQFDGGKGLRQALDYPFGLQFESTIYSWGYGDYKDFIFLRYDIINYSIDSLIQCWMAPVMDVDIARAPNTEAGAKNDRTRYFEEDPTMNLAFQWSGTEYGEAGNNFGYLGFNFLESPATLKCDGYLDTIINGEAGIYCYMYSNPSTDPSLKVYFKPTEEGYIRHDKRFYPVSEQLGLQTCRNWNIDDDPSEDDQRYNFLSSRQRDGDLGAGDKRFMMATGPFNMRPAKIDSTNKADWKYIPTDTVRVVVGIILANTSIRKEPDGTIEDAEELIRKVKFAQGVYDDNFRAPIPPERAVFTNWKAYNSAIKIHWDSTSEYSEDLIEGGLDFMGYNLYRGRNISHLYNETTNPLGLKLIGVWSIQSPFYKSDISPIINDTNANTPNIDSLRILGPIVRVDSVVPNKDNPNKLDTFKSADPLYIRVLRIPRGVVLYPDYMAKSYTRFITPIVASIDTGYYSNPWGKYFSSLAPNVETNPIWMHPMIDTGHVTHNLLFDSVMYGVLKLKTSLGYNPLLWKKETIKINISDTASLPNRNGDTIYYKNSYKSFIDGGTTYLTVLRDVPMPYTYVMTDSALTKQALDSVYSYIRQGMVEQYQIHNFEASKECKDVMAKYMDSITNHRTFFDIGDDDKNYTVEYNDDPTLTEKLINNMEYSYVMISFDEGSWMLKTQGKVNDAQVGLSNYVKTIPRAGQVGNKSQFEIISKDDDKLGGLYNFNMFAIDQERVNQLFGGHILELEFLPYWDLTAVQFTGRQSSHYWGNYYRRMVLKDLTTGDEVFNGVTMLEEELGTFSYRSAFTEDGTSWFFSDSVIVDTISHTENTFMVDTNTQTLRRSGKFTTGDFSSSNNRYSYAMKDPAIGALGFSFEYSLLQQGGIYRPFSAVKSNSNAVTPVKFYPDMTSDYRISDQNTRQDYIMTTQWVDYVKLQQEFSTYIPSMIYGSFNNGPGKYKIKFKAGGVEQLALGWSPAGSKVTKTFNVPYLTIEVENIAEYSRINEDGSSAVVKYPGPLKEMVLPDMITYDRYNAITSAWERDYSRWHPDPRNLLKESDSFIGGFNMYANGWVNGRLKHGSLNNSKQWTTPATGPLSDKTNASDFPYVGTQNRYYLSVVDGTDQLDFTHTINIGGCLYYLDYANKGMPFGSANYWERIKEGYEYGEDFKEGDEIIVESFGGALGLPMPGAKVRFKVSAADPGDNNITESMLDQVKIVPNPYYIVHQGQKSPYDAKIYFTKLPKRCTIDIYTINGDLIRSMQHDEYNNTTETTHAVEIWDLLSSNKQRIQSQTLVAVISTPNGEQSVQNFSVIVGGFRLISE